MMNKLFIDTRTGEIRTQFRISEIRFMRELKNEDIVNNTENEIKKMIKKEMIFRKAKGFD